MLLLYAIAAGLFRVSLTAGLDSSTPCYIQISNGTEYCYYYPLSGYSCDFGSVQDTNHHNLSACNSLGLCYVPVSNNKEVCYYSAPYGFDCYYEMVPELIANLTHCELLKANSPPDISFGGFPNVAEDTPLLISDVVINDVDARDSENEGKGYLLITIAAVNGKVRFSPDDLNAVSAARATAAQRVLDFPKDKAGIEWIVGNGSWATTLQMQIRCDPLLALLPSLEVQGNQDFTGQMQLQFTANDQGNTGGTAEIKTGSLSITITPVNDPPSIAWNPVPPATLEDTPLTITGLRVFDVDSASVEVTVTVTKGTLRLVCESTSCSGVTVVHLSSNKVLRATGAVAGRIDVPSALQTALSQLVYTPDADVNDNTGIEVMNVTANDKSSYLPTTTSLVDIFVTPVNDPPVLIAPALFQTDEDVVLVGLNLTVADVDTFYNQTVTLTVQHGLLYLGAPYVLGPAATITLYGSLTELQWMFRHANYTPSANFYGQDTLIVDLNDGGAGGNPPDYTIPITVWPVNDAPYFTTPAAVLALTGATGSDLTLSPAITVTDVDFTNHSEFTMQLVVQANVGTLKFTSITGITVTYPSSYTVGSYSPVFLIMGPQASVNDALSHLVYKRSATGSETVLLAVNDLRYYGSGGALTDYTLVPIA
eukprot:TRINITY_DN67_c0_g2_i1.p1 TRINITY_DN67_c0_g2~~TRINITY_DN67_c0_g2_i1.p1  ORF type:complete len:651 (-),score=107.05 TRINITY_DN67_c0_g2_i1:94-2046(-)